jgi:hypothetical protein
MLTLLSWAGTAQMALEEYLADHLPESFTRRTLSGVADELAAQRANAGDHRGEAFGAALDQLQQQIAAARRGLERGDRDALASALDSIRASNGARRQAQRRAP